MNMNVEGTLRAQQLLVDALVAVAEKGQVNDGDLMLLAALAEEGRLADEDVILIAEEGLSERLREEFCRRLGCSVFDAGGMFGAGAPNLAWNGMRLEN